jgi:RNA polymerase sigma-70 factor (ECF subfamily)
MGSEGDRKDMSNEERRTLRKAALEGGEAAREAFRALWRGYWPRVLGFCRSWLGPGGEDAEDAAAEILIRAFDKLGRYDPDRPFEPWLFALSSRYLASCERSGKRRAEREQRTYAPETAPDEANRVEREDELERMKRAIGELDPRERAMLELSYVEGLDSTAIGAAMGLAPGTVRWKLSAIRDKLKALMEAEHG